MVFHCLIHSSSSALSSQHPQTLRFFPREVKNIKHDRYFPQGLKRTNPHENYPHMREICLASCHAWRLAQHARFSRVRQALEDGHKHRRSQEANDFAC